MSASELKELLYEAYLRFATPDFIPNDPISIPKSFSNKEDIEIAAFLTATISWGNRKSIITSANKWMDLMDRAPADFIRTHQPEDRKRFKGFVHRTFKESDAMFFMESLQNIYHQHGGLEAAFSPFPEATAKERIAHFRKLFLSTEHLRRSTKHISDPEKNSSAKRLNMFLRWMTRTNAEGVDFGIWKSIPTSSLIMPLDIHTSTVGRKLGLLHRKQDDWKAAEDLTDKLRAFDPIDPVKYDFALFGIGAMGI